MDLLGVASEAMVSTREIRRWAFVRSPSIVDAKKEVSTILQHPIPITHGTFLIRAPLPVLILLSSAKFILIIWFFFFLMMDGNRFFSIPYCSRISCRVGRHFPLMQS